MGTCVAQIPTLLGGRWGQSMSLLSWDKSLQAWPVSASVSARLATHSIVFCFNYAVVSGVGLVTSSVLNVSHNLRSRSVQQVMATATLVRLSCVFTFSCPLFSQVVNSAEDFLVCFRHSHAFAAVSLNSVSCQFFLYLSVQQFASKTKF